MQRRLARELTVMVHSEADYDAAVAASEILFSATRPPTHLRNLDERTLLDVCSRVCHDLKSTVPNSEGGIPLLDLLAVRSPGVPLHGEARKMVQQGGVRRQQG